MLTGFRFRKLEEKGQAGRPRYGWEDSVTIDHKETRCDVGDDMWWDIRDFRFPPRC
jgi:hypothetical protein